MDTIIFTRYIYNKHKKLNRTIFFKLRQFNNFNSNKYQICTKIKQLIHTVINIINNKQKSCLLQNHSQCINFKLYTQQQFITTLISIMIPLPICYLSMLSATEFCISPDCGQSAFICNYCQNHYCKSLHYHQHGLITLRWSSIATPIQQFSSENIKINQIINNLKQKKFRKINGHQMNLLREELKINLQISNKYNQEHLEQITQQNINKNENERMEQLGILYFEEGKYELAEKELEKVLIKDKNNIFIYAYLEKIMNLLYSSDQIEQRYTKQISQNSNNQIMYYRRGRFYDTSKQYTKALQDFQQVNQIYLVHSDRGCAFYEIGQFEKAIAEYNKAVEFQPYSSLIYQDRAFCYQNINQFQKALIDYNKAIELDPRSTSIYNNRGILHQKLKQQDKAIDDYTKSIECDPTYFKAYYNRGSLLKKHLNYQQAIHNFNQAILHNPNYTKAYANRGMVYQLCKQYQKAINDYSTSIMLEPNNAKMYFNRAYIYYHLKKYDLSIDDYHKVIELDPNYSKAYLNRGLIYQKYKQYRKALDDYNKSVQCDPKYIKAYYNKVCVYEILNQLEEAINNCSKIIQYDPNFLKAYYKRASLYKQLKQIEKAQQDLDQIIIHDPTQMKAYLMKGIIYFQSGDLKTAQIYLIKSLQTEHKHTDQTYFYLARILLYKKMIDQSKIYLQKAIEFRQQYQYYLYKGILNELIGIDPQDDYQMAYTFMQSEDDKIDALKQIYKQFDKSNKP